MKIITQEEITQRIIAKWPNEPFKIIEYTRVTKPFEIKCLRCGKQYKYSSFNNFMSANRKGICSCYNENNKLTKHDNNIKEALAICEQKGILFDEFYYDNSNKKYRIRVQCPKCHQFYSKPLSYFCKNPTCYFCENSHELNTKGLKAKLPSEYILLSDYVNENTKVLVQHECGFIWPVIPKTLYHHEGCPKCNKKRSSGERTIGKYLDEKQIDYIIEKRFPWSSNWRRRYDFFLPDFNLIIEYHGRQHFEETNFFEITLLEQQKIDAEKEQEAREQGYNYLIISYQDFDNIHIILENWFNDYSCGKYIQVNRNEKHESEDIV